MDFQFYTKLPVVPNFLSAFHCFAYCPVSFMSKHRKKKHFGVPCLVWQSWSGSWRWVSSKITHSESFQMAEPPFVRPAASISPGPRSLNGHTQRHLKNLDLVKGRGLQEMNRAERVKQRGLWSFHCGKYSTEEATTYSYLQPARKTQGGSFHRRINVSEEAPLRMLQQHRG